MPIIKASSDLAEWPVFGELVGTCSALNRPSAVTQDSKISSSRTATVHQVAVIRIAFPGKPRFYIPVPNTGSKTVFTTRLPNNTF
jgi:hypothetical protein